MSGTIAAPLALTTTFSPPASCTQDIWGPDLLSLGGPPSGACFPPSFAPITTLYYSPAPYCPKGYYSASVLRDSEETTVTCCPSGYTINTRNWDYDWEHTLVCRSAFPSNTAFMVHVDSTSTSLKSVVVGDAVNAYSVQIRFQASDIPASTTSTSSTTTSDISTSQSTTAGSSQTSTTPSLTTSTVTSTSSGSSNPSANSNSNALSTSAKAGIGVGVSVGVLLAGAIIFLALTIRKRYRQNHPDPPVDTHFAPPAYKQEAQRIAELEGIGYRSELPGGNERVEMPQHRFSQKTSGRSELPVRSSQAL